MFEEKIVFVIRSKNGFIYFALQMGSLYRKQFNNESYYKTVFGNF
jgi:hypothetical protein